MGDFQEIKNEDRRTYIYPDGQFTVEGVVRLLVRPSGTHRLETADGRKFIVAAGWLAIEVVAKDWSV